MKLSIILPLLLAIAKVHSEEFCWTDYSNEKSKISGNKIYFKKYHFIIY